MMLAYTSFSKNKNSIQQVLVECISGILLNNAYQFILIIFWSRRLIHSTTQFLIKLLTGKDFRIILLNSLPNEVIGIGLSETNGVSRTSAVFLCAKSQFTFMLDWARQSNDWLDSFVPVGQPCLARHHDWPHVVGFKNHTDGVIMTNHIQVPPKTKALTHSVSLKSIFLLFDSNKQLIADNLSFEQIKPLADKFSGSVIKFQRMELVK